MLAGSFSSDHPALKSRWGGHLNVNGWTLNLDGGPLTLDKGTRPLASPLQFMYCPQLFFFIKYRRNRLLRVSFIDNRIL